MSNVSMSDAEMLKFAIENGMIDTALVQEKIEMQRREELLNKHPYSIWEDKDGMWHTYLPDKNNGRVHKKRKNKEDLEGLIIDFWKEETENPTVKDIFYQWLDEKIEYCEISKATYDRYENDFKRYFMNDGKFGNRKIKDISEEDIESFIKKTIADNNLTSKAYGNFRTLIYGIFKKCKKNVNFSITQVVGDIQISKKSFKKNIKEEKYEVFDEEELKYITDYLVKNKDMINLGILLIFSSGIRVGELCTLKWSDIEDNILKIRRTETVYKGDKGENIYSVKEFPKTEAGVRNVIIPTSDIWILKDIRSMNPFGTYLFENNGERLKALFFRKRLYKICDKIGIVKKSPHKIRKTYGTILLDSGIDQRLVLDQMGHSDILCSENHYHRNRKNTDKKTEIIDGISELCITG